MLENDLTNIEMLIMKCIWDTPESWPYHSW